MSVQVNANTAASGAVNLTVSTVSIGGAEFQKILLADPATGVEYKIASEATLALVLAALSHVGIDQTTPGTTNAVSVGASITSLPLPNGAATSANQPTLTAGRAPSVSSVPTAGSGTILSLTTNATGATFNAFSSQACVALDIVNNTNTTIEYRRNGVGTAMQIPAGAARMVIGITDASQISVRRTDTSNTQVTVQAEALTL